MHSILDIGIYMKYSAIYVNYDQAIITYIKMGVEIKWVIMQKKKSCIKKDSAKVLKRLDCQNFSYMSLTF